MSPAPAAPSKKQLLLGADNLDALADWFDKHLIYDDDVDLDLQGHVFDLKGIAGALRTKIKESK